VPVYPGAAGCRAPSGRRPRCARSASPCARERVGVGAAGRGSAHRPPPGCERARARAAAPRRPTSQPAHPRPGRSPRGSRAWRGSARGAR